MFLLFTFQDYSRQMYAHCEQTEQRDRRGMNYDPGTAEPSSSWVIYKTFMYCEQQAIGGEHQTVF